MHQDFLAFLNARGVLPPARLEAMRQQIQIPREPIGAIAFAHGLLTGEDIDVILSAQREEHRPFGQIAVEQGLLTPAQVEMLVKFQDARSALSIAEAMSLAEIVPMWVLLSELAEYFTAGAVVAKAA